MERKATKVARRLLSVIEENWGERWLQSMLKDAVKGEPVPKDLIPEVLEEMVLLIRRKTRP